MAPFLSAVVFQCFIIMQISELIVELTRILESDGDIDVCYDNGKLPRFASAIVSVRVLPVLSLNEKVVLLHPFKPMQPASGPNVRDEPQPELPSENQR